jgi:hypothetical protein
MKYVLMAGMLLAAVGCGPIRYDADITPVAGNSVFVDQPVIHNCHPELDKAGTENEIRTRAQDLLRGYGYTVAADAASADLVLKASVTEFQLGSRAARIIAGAGQAWHDTTIQITPRGGTTNAGRRRAEVSAGAFNNYKGAEAHRLAVANEIAKMHVWVAGKYCPR